MSTFTLDQLITEACEQYAPNEPATRYYTAALGHAQSFRRELLSGAGRGRSLRVAYLDLGDDRTVALPDDYDEYTMLGMTLPGWGGVRNLIYNDRLSLVPGANHRPLPAWLSSTPIGQAPDFLLPDFLTPPTANECETACYGALDADTDAYCGYGAAWYGDEFRLDRAGRRIVCSSRVPGGAVLVLEYYGFGACDGEDISLDPLAHSWGLHYVLERLWAQKKDWNTVSYHAAAAKREMAVYRERTRHFSLDGAMLVKHRAAAQRWK